MHQKIYDSHHRGLSFSDPIKTLNELKQQFFKQEEVVILIEKLSQKISRIQTYILGLLGKLPENSKDSEQMNAMWMRIQADYKEETNKKFELPTWVKVFLCIPAGIPYGIVKLIEWRRQIIVNQKFIEEIKETIKNSNNDLQFALDTKKIKKLEQLIEKQQSSHLIPRLGNRLLI